MKKHLLFSLSLVLGATAAVAADGDPFSDGQFTYEAMSDTEVILTGVDKSVTEAVIPATVTNDGVTYSVTAIGENAFKWSNVTTATLPSTVTTIDYGGFYNADKLVSVTLNEGLESIGDYGFGYTKISSIKLPSTLKSIGGSCFFRCDNLTQVEFPAGLQSIGNSCFYKVPLTKVELPEGMTEVAPKAFLLCDKLVDVKLPSTITTIGEGAFYGTAITSIELPAGLKSIGKEAFYNCPLTSIELPAALETIGGAAFSGTQLAKFDIAESNKNFTNVGDVLFTADKSLLVIFPPKCALTELTLPAECLGISYGAFDKTGIQKVTLGNKFRAIDDFAFSESKLSQINFPASLVYIGEQAFAGTNLTTAELPKSLTMIQDATFAQCKALNSVTIPASVTYIALRAFFQCSSLTTINAEGMTPATLEDWYEEWENPFYEIASTAVVNVPKGTAAAYKASNWGYCFSDFTESLPAQLLSTETSPAEGASISSFDGVKVTFGENVTIVNSNPDVQVIEGQLVAGIPVGSAVSVDGWMVTKEADNQIYVWPADYDYYKTPFNMEDGKDYYVVIPAGVVKNAAGEVNAELTLHYAGAYVAPVVELVEVTPADNSKVNEITTLSFKFAESVALQQSKLSSIKVIKGTVVDGVPVGDAVTVEQWWPVSGKTSGTEISIFAGDEYDGYVMPIALQAGADYYIELPAGLFRLSSSYNTTSERIILHYYNGDAAIMSIGSDAQAAPAEIYTLEGIRVNEMAPGRVYIVRQGSKVTKQVVK